MHKISLHNEGTEEAININNKIISFSINKCWLNLFFIMESIKLDIYITTYKKLILSGDLGSISEKQKYKHLEKNKRALL